MSLTTEEVAVCNQALDRVGSKNFTYAVQTSVEALKCITIYTQTRDALLRSFEWSFASARKTLSPEVNDPEFEWDYRFKLPDDFLRYKSDYGLSDSYAVDARFTIEGKYYLTNNDEVDLLYIKKVENPDDFDPLFTEVLILTLAKKLIPALAGTKNPGLVESVDKDLADALSHARVVCRQESNVSGRSDWRQARHSVNTNSP
ncbi:hypothetical protein LCGC14_1725780 [marine sediment metagenome]|uniref:Tail tubular protein A n=1 Tax=marine sediment metagenome TaxID=412755 RepID=A0A0F9HAY5_9ZZZZ